jgi:hypothetical protein
VAWLLEKNSALLLNVDIEGKRSNKQKIKKRKEAPRTEIVFQFILLFFLQSKQIDTIAPGMLAPRKALENSSQSILSFFLLFLLIIGSIAILLPKSMYDYKERKKEGKKTDFFFSEINTL